jgi:polyhydroxyalkanoate synthase
VRAEIAPFDTALATLWRGQFMAMDALRRAQGTALDAFGLGPREHPYQAIDAGYHWRLRDYGGHAAAQPLLIVAAPIKRPYIWDLAPSASAIGLCLREGLHVYLIEWTPPSRNSGNTGLDECVDAISVCIERIADRHAGKKPFLAGHSLGGTLAAIYSAAAGDSIAGLVLLSAPLCFQPDICRFRDALVSLIPTTLSADTELFPGSLLSHMSALAAPGTFIWSRQADAVLSVIDPQALDIHARVERWALDEAPLPGRLVHQIVDWFYREDFICRGNLMIKGKRTGPFSLAVPTLAIVNTSDEIAPSASIEPFLKAMPTQDVRIIEYAGEIGVCLQHLAILIGREAHAHVWPQIFTWLHSHRQGEFIDTDESHHAAAK